MMETVVHVCLLKRLPNATWPVLHGPFFWRLAMAKRGRPRVWYRTTRKKNSPSRRQDKPWNTVTIPLEIYAMLSELVDFHKTTRTSVVQRLIYAEFIRTLNSIDPEKALEMEKVYAQRFVPDAPSD